MASGIYQILSPSGKFYIGSASCLPQRLNNHRWHLARGTHHSPALQAAYAKYGWDGLQKRVLLLCSVKDLLFYEQLLLDAWEPKFNTAKEAGSRKGTRQPASAVEAARQKNRGRKWTPEQKERLHLALQSSSARKEADEKRRGVPRPPEVREALRLANIGKKASPATREKLRAAKLGKKQSAELVAKRITPASVAKMKATKQTPVRCHPLGTVFPSTLAAGGWLLENGLTADLDAKRKINRAIKTGRKIYGFTWERLEKS